jgi:hypothetical protein
MRTAGVAEDVNFPRKGSAATSTRTGVFSLLNYSSIDLEYKFDDPGSPFISGRRAVGLGFLFKPILRLSEEGFASRADFRGSHVSIDPDR